MTTEYTGPDGPSTLTSLFGRAEVLAEVQKLLRRKRLVTLAGPGGVGKSRLAVEVGRQYGEHHNVPVAVAYLLNVTPDALNREVVAALGIVDQSSRDPIDVLIDRLGHRETLLVLDNCEHLLDPVGDLLATLLEEAPHLHVLTTSRGYLEVSGEHVYQVPPLELPDPDDACPSLADRSDDAMALLLDRAAAAGRAITADDDWDAVVRLARWSGGLPLVLELIAVRLGGGMSPRAILERLAGGKLLGAQRSRRVQPHHRTLQQTLEWSLELCSPGERRLWARISVFADGFDLEAAEKVCSGDGIDAYDVVDLLGGLVRWSIVISTPEGRYHQLPPQYEFGRRLLHELGEEDAVRRRHSHAYAELAADAAVRWPDRGEVAWLGRGIREWPNFRVALHHCANTPDMAETGLLITMNLARLRLCFFDAKLGEFCAWFELFLDLIPVAPTPARIGASAMLGWIRLCQGSQAQAAEQLAHCHDLVRALGGTEVAPVRFLEGAYAALAQDDSISMQHAGLAPVPAIEDTHGELESIHLLMRATELFAQAGEDYAGDRMMAQLICALAAGFAGDEETATRISEDCLADAAASGAEWMISWAQWTTGLAPLRYGSPDEAIDRFQCALATQIGLGDKWGTTWCAEAIAWALSMLDSDFQMAAAELLGGAITLQKDTGVAIAGLVPFGRERSIAVRTARNHLGEDRYREAYQRGTELTKEEVYQLALRPPAGSSAATLDSLSPRRRQIAMLIAQGWENRQIADELNLALSTVENHVSDILRIGGFANRAQIAAWVSRQLNTINKT